MLELQVYQSITIKNEKYIVDKFPNVAEEQVFAIDSGREATIYRLIRQSDSALHALKVFRATQREQRQLMNQVLMGFRDIPGMSVLKKRYFITKENEPALVNNFPEMDQSVLMPWLPGKPLSEIISSKIAFTREESLNYAQQIASTLSELERRGAAHCDAASDNIIIDQEGKKVEFIDSDLLFEPNMPEPPGRPQGKDGYQLPNNEGQNWHQWKPEGDRFSGAILICEVLCWYDEKIRDLVVEFEEETFFQQTQLINHREKLAVKKHETMKETLQSTAKDAVPLFEKVWRASDIKQCPTLIEWNSALIIDVLPELNRTWNSLVLAGDDEGLVVLAGQFRVHRCSLTPDQMYILLDVQQKLQVIHRLREAMRGNDDAKILAAYQPIYCDKALTDPEKQRLSDAQTRLKNGPFLRRAIYENDIAAIDAMYIEELYKNWLTVEEQAKIRQLKEQEMAIKHFEEVVQSKNFEEAQKIYTTGHLQQIWPHIPKKERLTYLDWEVEQDLSKSSPVPSASGNETPLAADEAPPITQDELERKGLLRRLILARKENKLRVIQRIISVQGLDPTLLDRELQLMQDHQPLFGQRK